jgi:hypothetical protein
VIEGVVGPIRERKKGISDREVEEVLKEGGERARELASRKMEEVNHLILH